MDKGGKQVNESGKMVNQNCFDLTDGFLDTG